MSVDDLRQADGTSGYSDQLLHGVNGLDEIRRSVEFIKEMRARYYG